MNGERIRWLKARAADLHRMADELYAQAMALERDISDRPIIGGRDLMDVVVAVLMAEGNGGMHYTDLLARIEDESGARVRGVDPSATLLANIQRDPRIVTVRPRSGIYMLAEAGERLEERNAG